MRSLAGETIGQARRLFPNRHRFRTDYADHPGGARAFGQDDLRQVIRET